MKSHGGVYDDYSNTRIKLNDVINIAVDANKQALSFELNNEPLGMAYTMDLTQYQKERLCAYVAFFNPGETVTIV